MTALKHWLGWPDKDRKERLASIKQQDAHYSETINKHYTELENIFLEKEKKRKES